MRARCTAAVTSAPLVVPGALLLLLSFQSAGVGPGATAAAALGVGCLLAIRVALAGPLAGVSRGQLVVGGALSAFALWTLLSALWSGSPARAMIEYDRALLYVLVFALLATVVHTSANLRLLLRGLFATMLVVCLAALISRVLPGLVTVDGIFDNSRLRYPLESWNGVGLMAGLGILLALHHCACDREHRAIRLVAAGALPLLAATLLLTYSRAGLAAAVLGVSAYILLARERNLIGGLLATTPPTIVAVVAARGADLLATQDPASLAASAQGRILLLILTAAAATAIGLHAALSRRERSPRITLSPFVRRWAAVVLVPAVISAGLAFAIADRIPQRALTQVSDAEGSKRHADVQGRFRNISIDRNDHWRVALDAWQAAPMLGNGAGTFELLWDRQPGLSPGPSIDAHSLYHEVLGELGLVGLALILLALLPILAALSRRIRGPDRAVYAVAFAAVLTWLVHAAVHWDWEKTAMTAWVIGVGGLVLGRTAAATPRPGTPSRRLRAGAAIACAGLLVVPILIVVSEHRLRGATQALLGGDCASAVTSAEGARTALSPRPESHTILGICALRSHRPTVATRHFERARKRDPRRWKAYYGLAIARAASGRDPTALIRAAQDRNRTDQVILAIARRLAVADTPRLRKQVAAEAPLPVADRVVGDGQRFEIWSPRPGPDVTQVLPSGEALF